MEGEASDGEEKHGEGRNYLQASHSVGSDLVSLGVGDVRRREENSLSSSLMLSSLLDVLGASDIRVVRLASPR